MIKTRQVLFCVGMILCTSVNFTQISGVLNIIGTIAPYILSYYYSIDSSISLSSTVAISLSGIIFQVACFYLVSTLARCIREQYILIVGLLSGTALMYFSSYLTSISLFIIVFGQVLGIMGSSLFYPPVWIAVRNMPSEHKGLVIGLGTGSFAISPFVYGVFFTLVINPNNEKPNHSVTQGDLKCELFGEEVYQRFPMTVRYLSILFLIVGLVGIASLWEKSRAVNNQRVTSTITVKQLLGMEIYWYCFFMNFCKVFYFFFFANVYKSLEILYIRNDYVLAYISTVGFTLGAILRVILGSLFDKFLWVDIVSTLTLIEVGIALIYYYLLESSFFNALFTVITLIVLNTDYLSMWVLTEQIFPNDKWVFSFISFGNPIILLSVFLFTAYIIPVRFI